jgi:hypothetical protein
MLGSLVQASRRHLSGAGETYFQHMRFAGAVGCMLVAAAIACLLHALIPGVCTTTASDTIRRLQLVMSDRDRILEAAEGAEEATSFSALLMMSVAAAASVWLAGAAPLIALPLSLMALGLPAAFLLSNPQLQPPEESPLRA